MNAGACRSTGAALALLAASLTAQQATKELDALLDQLGGADATARSQAFQTLQRERNPDVVGRLDKRIAAFAPAGQQLALYLLQQHAIDTTRPVYTHLLTAERPLLRATAAAMLVRHGERTHLPLLSKAVATTPREDRLQVLNALWSIDDPAVRDAVRGYVEADANGPLLVAALALLRQQEKGQSDATTTVVRRLQTSADADVRAAALLWLVHGPDGEAAATALAALLREDGNRFWRIERLLERDRKQPAALTDALVAALAAPRAGHDVAWLATLVKLQAPDRVLPALRQLLDHKNTEVRNAAMQALAATPGGLEPKDLLQLLRAGNAEQQVLAAGVLRRMDDASGLPIVIGLVQEPGTRTAEAVRVLASFRSREVVEPLLAALDDGKVQVRQFAWTGLQQVLGDLFPYRRFAFDRAGYNPGSEDRAAGLQTLRAWWATVR